MYDRFYYSGDLNAAIQRAVNLSRTEFAWILFNAVDYTDFNLRWIPPTHQRNQCHVWSSHHNANSHTVWLIPVDYIKQSGKLEYNYHSEILPAIPGEITGYEWVIDHRIDYTDFNFNWLPNRSDWHKTHAFAMKNTNELAYTFLKMYDNADIQYHTSDLMFKVGAASDEWQWITDPRIDYTNFDFNWLPDRWDSDKINCFPMRGTEKLAYTKLVNLKFSTTEEKYQSGDLWFSEPIPRLTQEEYINSVNDNLEWVWIIDNRIDYSNFDFTWLPDAWDIDKVNCFAMDNTEELCYTKLINTKHCKNKQKFHRTNLNFSKPIPKVTEHERHLVDSEWVWVIDDRIDYTNFNFNWLPDFWDKEKKHCFTMKGTKQLYYTYLYNTKQLITEEKFYESNLYFKEPIVQVTDAESIVSIDSEWVWVVDPRVDYKKFDFNWLPDSYDLDKTHCFVMYGHEQLSYTKLVNTRYTQIENKYHLSNLKFKRLIQDKLYWPNFNNTMLSGFDWNDKLANWVIEQELEGEWVWIIDSRVDYTDFDFSWLPEQWDHDFIHCFTLKDMKKLSYTWLINCKTVKNKKFKYHSGDLVLNDHAYESILIDMGNQITNDSKFDKKIRFTGSMTDVLRSAVKRANKEWLYVGSSISDYTNVNLKWLPDLDRINYVHCWPSTNQIKGESFLIHTPTYSDKEHFEFDFDHDIIPRHHWPIFEYTSDNIKNAIDENKNNTSLYTVYCKQASLITSIPEPCLWENRPVVGMNKGNSVSLVPRDCVVKKEIYEYPYLTHTDSAIQDKLDIIFISNGEKQATENFTELNLKNPLDTEIKISYGVNGRLNAYQSAANLSDTDWFLAVFAKCFMTDTFKNFSWRPDYWQQPKHYIFYNHNYDLDMTYGHMAPIAYNKKLMLENKGGLDMTLAQEHAVVPITISETRLIDPWETWRTAFRETIKLMYYAKNNNSIELRYRLDKWIKAELCWTKHNPWYQYGSNDAKDFFESIDGDLGWILMTNEWDWLRQKFKSLYPKEPF